LHYKTEEACLVGKSLCEIEIEEEGEIIKKEENQINKAKAVDLGIEDILKAEEKKEEEGEGKSNK
jgi:hypothetical protein